MIWERHVPVGFQREREGEGRERKGGEGEGVYEQIGLVVLCNDFCILGVHLRPAHVCLALGGPEPPGSHPENRSAEK